MIRDRRRVDSIHGVWGNADRWPAGQGAAHHLHFRNQGGTDHPDNVIGLCTWCHLHGIHTHGSIKAEAPSTCMTWKTTVLEVEGREVVWRREG